MNNLEFTDNLITFTFYAGKDRYPVWLNHEGSIGYEVTEKCRCMASFR